MERPNGYDQEKTQGTEPPFDIHDRELRNFSESQLKQAQGGLCGAQAYRPMTSAEILAELFSYHPPNSETLPKFAAINQAAKNFAEVILQNCPPSADRSDAIRKIREARMTANAAVGLNGLSL
jgi:hypothetical protein